MQQPLINELDLNLVVIKSLFNGINPEMYLWKATAKKWCLLEVLCHLVDEEKEDFRPRLKHVLDGKTSPFTPIEPEKWVTERGYINENYELKLEEWLKERQQSVEWLKGLKNVDWTCGINHLTFGFMDGNMLLANWLAHDYLHIRQILGIKYAYQAQMHKQNLVYAGNW